MAQMDSVHRGLLILPRADLSNAFVDVVEWRMRAHDGTRLWGLRALSPFHPEPAGVCVREVSASELPTVRLETVTAGWAEVVLQVPAGRRLEDRVLDLLRVVQVSLTTCGVDVEAVRMEAFVAGDDGNRPADEVVIADRLVRAGICSMT